MSLLMGWMSTRLIWNFSALGVVQTSVPMRPLPIGMPSSLRATGMLYIRSARETTARTERGNRNRNPEPVATGAEAQ